MADKESSIQIVEHPNHQNPLFSLFSNFLQLFNSPPPLAPKSEKKAVPVSDAKPDEPKVSAVRFSDTSPQVPPLKLESEESERDTNPVLLWQVYAVGGFFVLRWAWARWNERRGKNRPSDNDDQAAAADS